MSSVAASGPAIRTQRIRAIQPAPSGPPSSGTTSSSTAPRQRWSSRRCSFPDSRTFTGILLSFGTQFVGFAARPIGAAIFGHFGDRIGRKATLIATLLLMGIAHAS